MLPFYNLCTPFDEIQSKSTVPNGTQDEWNLSIGLNHLPILFSCSPMISSRVQKLLACIQRHKLNTGKETTQKKVIGQILQKNCPFVSILYFFLTEYTHIKTDFLLNLTDSIFCDAHKLIMAGISIRISSACCRTSDSYSQSACIIDRPTSIRFQFTRHLRGM